MMLVGGTVFAREKATAVAIRDARVVALGTEDALLPYFGERTRIIDLDGRMLLPGFEDDHLHLDAGAARLAWQRAVKPFEPSSEAKLEHLERAARYLNRFGITSAHTSSLVWPDAGTLLESLERRGRLPLRLRLESATTPHDSLRKDDAHLVAHVHPFKISPDWFPLSRRGKPELRLRRLVRAGFELCFGSDWPLAPLDPLAGIAAAVSRRDFDEKPQRGFLPEEKLTRTEAIHAYTRRFLEPGAPADLTVVSHDLWTLPEEQIASAKTEMTIFAGRVVYVSASFAAELGTIPLAVVE